MKNLSLSLISLLLVLTTAAQTITGSFGAHLTATQINGVLVTDRGFNLPTDMSFSPTRAWALRANTSTGNLELWDGALWNPITGGGGSSVTISVASANGFAGSATTGSTPVITLSTTVTGLLKGNGTAISAAVAGTDYVATESDPTVAALIKAIPVSADATTNKYLNWNGSAWIRKQIAYGEISGAPAAGITAANLTLGTLTSTTIPINIDVGTDVTLSSFTASNAGLVPAPGTVAGKVLSDNGSWITVLTSYTESDPVFTTNGVTLATNQTITSNKTFSNTTFFSGLINSSGGIYINNAAIAFFQPSGGFTGNFGVNLVGETMTGNRTWELPNASGVLALRSDIPSTAGFVPNTTTLTINTVAFDLSANRTWSLDLASVTTAGNSTINQISTSSFNINDGVAVGNSRGNLGTTNLSGTTVGILSLRYGAGNSIVIRPASAPAAGRLQLLPDKDGTFAMTSDLSGFVTSEVDPVSVHTTGNQSSLSGNKDWTGTHTFANSATFSNGLTWFTTGQAGTNVQGQIGSRTNGTNYWGNIKFGNDINAFTTSISTYANSPSADRLLTLPNASGTIPLSVTVNSTNYTADNAGVINLGTISGGGGGVSQVTFPTAPSWLTASVATNTTTPAISLTATTGQTANQFLATPNGSTGAVGLRAIVAADLPDLSATYVTLGTTQTITADKTMANLALTQGLTWKSGSGSVLGNLNSSTSGGNFWGMITLGSTVNANVGNISVPTLTALRTWTLPDATGTFALTSDITALSSTYQPLDGDLTSIAGLAGTSGFLQKTAANTWTLNTTTFATDASVVHITGNETITGAKTLSALLTVSAANGINIGDANYQIKVGTSTFQFNITSAVATNGYGWYTDGVKVMGLSQTGTLTLTGSLGITGTRISKGWFTDIESTNMPTVGGVSLSSTFQPLDGDLTSIAGLAGTSGFLQKTAANTWVLNSAATQVTQLGATTVGSNLFTLTNPSAITFLRVNADNTVSALDAATFRTAIGAGTGGGSVTNFSAGDLSPLFTTTEATTTTTPALTFVLSNAAPHTFFGNNTASTAAPAYVAITAADLPDLSATYLAVSTSPDLLAIEALSGTSGFLQKTAANTWSLNTTTLATDASVVHIAGSESITGTKSFSAVVTMAGGISVSGFGAPATGAKFTGFQSILGSSQNLDHIREITNNGTQTMVGNVWVTDVYMNGGGGLSGPITGQTSPLYASVGILQRTVTAGAGNITDLTSFYIDGAPIISGTGGTFGTPTALWVRTGTSKFGGGVQMTGLSTATQTSMLYIDASGNISKGALPSATPSNLALGTATTTTLPITNSNGTGFTLPTFSTTAGLVPGTTSSTTNFLRADGTWAAPSGGSGSGTVNSGTAGNLAYYATTGTVVSEVPISYDASTLGVRMPAIKLWRNGGTGTSAEVLNEVAETGLSGGLIFKTTAGSLSFVAGSQGFNVIPNGSATTFDFVYGTSHGFLESGGSHLDVYGGSGLDLRLGANGTVNYLTISTAGQLNLSVAPTTYSTGSYDVLVRNQTTGNIEKTTITGGGADALGTYIVKTATNAPANAQVLASLSTGILKVTTTTGILTTAVAADFPTLNQSTTGNAGTATALQTARTLWGNSFDGTASINGSILLSTNSIQMTGSLGLTGGRVLKGWFIDAEFTNMPTVGGSSLSTIFQATDADLTTLAASTGTKDNTTYYAGDGTFHPAGLTRAFGMSAPTATENIMIWYTPVAVTITNVQEALAGTSPSVTYILGYSSTRSGALTNIVNSHAATTTTGAAATLTANVAVPAGSYIMMTTSATSGTVNDFNISISFRQ
jgi:hypothetical protein